LHIGSLVGIGLDQSVYRNEYKQEDWGLGTVFLIMATDFSLLYSFETDPHFQRVIVVLSS